MEDTSELQVLRSRLVASALEERRRIGRALHDGPQQDLIGISVLLQLVRNCVATSPAETLSALDEAQRETRNASDRLRLLADEIYPSILDARGLPDALRLAAGGSEVAAQVETEELGRYPAEIEAAVFFAWRAVLDSLGSSANAVIRLREEAEALRVEIGAQSEVDLDRVRDLVEGAGGVLEVKSESEDCRVEGTFLLG